MKPKKIFNNGRSDDKGAVTFVNTAPQLGCVSQDSEPPELSKRMKYRGNPRRKVLGSIRWVRFKQSTLREASIRENKGPSLGKYRQNPSSAKSLRHEIWGQISRRDWKTRVMRPRQGVESCQKHLQSHRNWQSYIPFAYRLVDMPAASTMKPEEREFVVDSRACIWSARKTLTLPNSRPWGYRKIRRW